MLDQYKFAKQFSHIAITFRIVRVYFCVCFLIRVSLYVISNNSNILFENAFMRKIQNRTIVENESHRFPMPSILSHILKLLCQIHNQTLITNRIQLKWKNISRTKLKWVREEKRHRPLQWLFNIGILKTTKYNIQNGHN